MAMDPVCKMTVDPETAPAKTEYKGKTYYFCAPGCKVAFEKDPEKYLKGDYPNELQKAEAEITLAKEELTRAQDSNEWSMKLYAEKYISYGELQADRLAVKKKQLDKQFISKVVSLIFHGGYFLQFDLCLHLFREVNLILSFFGTLK